MRSEYLGGSELKWIPDGFHFLGIEEAKKRRSTIEKIHGFFEGNEFHEVFPSAYDFTSSFQNHIMISDKKKIFKAKDNRGVEISPSLDLTLQVVKGMAGFNSELDESNVYYIGKIIKDTEIEMGGRREYTQAGAEVIGSSHIKSIIKIFQLMDGLCKELEIPNKITLVVGNVGVVISILEVLGYPVDSIPELIPFIYSKNTVELKKLLKNYMKYSELIEFLFKLHLSFDPKIILPELKILNTRYNLKISEIIEESEILFNDSSEKLSSLNLCLDYTLFRDLDYYTGFIFQGYGFGSSQPVFTGGAYDKLFEKFTGKEKRACGFALNIDIYEDIIGNE